ncbi:response regulator transcription factor [Nocardia araoensis]|uniref:response regulator transcription factor n=1 Tax=Nocardia araoensis TaxID=228600 RepID=UPI0005855267|nr:response regulator transcription factor [Nocardia araoensis]
MRDYLDPAEGSWGSVFEPHFEVEFADYDQLAMRRDADGAPIVLPVNSETQAESLRSVRARHAMGLIVAVTDDVGGYSTYAAIRSGANFVINVAISVERQADLVRAQLLDHTRSAPRKPLPAVLGAVTGRELNEPARQPLRRRVGTPAAGPDQSGRHGLTESDTRLLRMLRTSMTVAEIARLNYLSERSMYRRIRSLYDTLGVGSRAELVGSERRADVSFPLTVLRG